MEYCCFNHFINNFSVNNIFFSIGLIQKHLHLLSIYGKKQIRPLEQWAVAVTDYSKQLEMTF